MLSVLLAAALQPQTQAPPPQTVFEWLSLDHLCREAPGPLPPRWGTMLALVNTLTLDLLGAGKPVAHLDPGLIRDLLAGPYDAELESGKLRLDAAEASLLVAGDAAIVARLREQFEALGNAWNRPLQVEVVLWDAGNGPSPGAVLGPDGYAHFAERHVALWRGRAETRSSRAVALDQQRWTRYVRDVDVEVAQKATIAQPITDAFGEGGRVVVVPHALVGSDDLALHVQFGLAEKRGPVPMLPTGAPARPDLDVPVLETSFGGCSGRIGNGGALAVTLRGLPASGGNRVLTIQVASRARPAAAPPGFAVFPIGALCSQALLETVTLPDLRPQFGDDRPRVQAERTNDGFCVLDAASLLELVKQAIAIEPDPGVMLQVAGNHMIVQTPADRTARAEEFLRALQDRLLRTVTVQQRARLEPTEPAGSPALATPLHEIVVPTLVGRMATVGRVLETNVLRDVFVEIAQEASASNPAVEAMQAGAWLRARVSPVGSGMHLCLLAQCAHGEAPTPRRVAPAGALSLPTLASTRVDHDGAVASGQPIEHGDGPPVRTGDRACRSALATTVTW
ncbi:MAG: hypothetical protein FJ265_08395 [Planctomycetes bacterium]|nr:hypothetical protein [Planctomycetota bacterium]